MIYEIIESEQGKSVKRVDDDGAIWIIPSDPANSDYQAYLAQLEGKEPALPEITETPKAE